jgi:hypothetical protein
LLGQTGLMLADEVEYNPLPRGKTVSVSEIAGYALLLAAVWQGSGLVSQLAALVGSWLSEPPGPAVHLDEV